MSDIEAFQERYNVSRETLDRLSAYEQAIRKWNRTINLVANSTLDAIWTRHFMESAELFHILPVEQGRWLDLGSGGGFPGAVVALMAEETGSTAVVTCVEADIRKAAFLRSLEGSLRLPMQVASRRAEEMPPQKAAVVSARALAPLVTLLKHCERHLAVGGQAIFPKGRTWRSEVEEALESYSFSVENHPSPTAPDSAILVIGDLARA